MSDKERSIGALWLKEGGSGQFFSGVLELEGQEKISIVVFQNGYKTETKHPDYKIFRARDQGAARNETPPQSPAAPADDVPPPGHDDVPPFK